MAPRGPGWNAPTRRSSKKDTRSKNSRGRPGRKLIKRDYSHRNCWRRLEVTGNHWRIGTITRETRRTWEQARKLTAGRRVKYRKRIAWIPSNQRKEKASQCPRKYIHDLRFDEEKSQKIGVAATRTWMSLLPTIPWRTISFQRIRRISRPRRKKSKHRRMTTIVRMSLVPREIPRSKRKSSIDRTSWTVCWKSLTSNWQIWNWTCTREEGREVIGEGSCNRWGYTMLNSTRTARISERVSESMFARL